LNPPPGATLCTVELECLDDFSNMRVVCFDIMQSTEEEPLHMNKSYFRCTSRSKKVMTVECEHGRTVEVGVCQYALSFPYGTRMRQTITYSGLECPKELFVDGNAHISQFQVNSNVKEESFEPKATLTHLLHPVPPSKAEITKCGERDFDISKLQNSQLILDYTFDMAAKAEVYPTFPLLDQLLYSGTLTSQWILFDSNKKYILCGDNWDIHKTTLDKQKGYTLRMHIMSEDASKLEALKSTRCVLRIACKSKEGLPIYSQRNGAGLKQNKVTKVSLAKGEKRVYYLGALDDKKVPSIAKPGDVLEGQLLLQKEKDGVCTYRRTKEAPGGYGEKSNFAKIFYTVPVKVPAKKGDDAPKEKDMMVNYIQATIKSVKGLGKVEVQREAFTKFVEPLLNEIEAVSGNISYLRILQCKMELVADEEHAQKIEAANNLIEQINLQDLSAYFGVNHDMAFASDEEKLDKACKEETKKILIEALKCKLKALLALSKEEAEIEECYKFCKEWIKDGDDSLAECKKYLAKQSKRLGTLLKLTYKSLSPNEKGDAKPAPSKKQHDEVLVLLRELGWDHIADRYEIEREVCFPQSYRPF